MGMLEDIKKEFGEIEFEIRELDQARQILVRIANQLARSNAKFGIPNPISGIYNALNLIKAAEGKLK
jgi:hypothetical protein